MSKIKLIRDSLIYIELSSSMHKLTYFESLLEGDDSDYSLKALKNRIDLEVKDWNEYGRDSISLYNNEALTVSKFKLVILNNIAEDYIDRFIIPYMKFFNDTNNIDSIYELISCCSDLSQEFIIRHINKICFHYLYQNPNFKKRKKELEQLEAMKLLMEG
jgi:hypothetical protein